MASKSLIKNKINGKVRVYPVPVDAAGATTFATDMMDGELAVYSLANTIGNETVTEAPIKLNVMMSNTTGDKAYANFVIPSTKTENDLFGVLKGKTINGVLVDYCVALSVNVCPKF